MAKKEEVQVEINELEQLKVENRKLKQLANALIARLKQEGVNVDLKPETEKLLKE